MTTHKNLRNLKLISFSTFFVVLGLVFYQNFSVPKDPATPYVVYNSPQRINSEVFRGLGYNHAATVGVRDSKIYVAWNGNRYNSSEGYAGQVIMLSSSADGGRTWSAPTIPFVNKYRAQSQKTGGGIDAEPGQALDDYKIKQNNLIEWQPSLVNFKGDLVMFWGFDRNAANSTMMMSVLEPKGDQWRSHEFHFTTGTGQPYLYSVQSSDTSYGVADPGFIQIQKNMAQAYPAIRGVESIPQQISIQDLPLALIQSEDLTKSQTITGPMLPLIGHKLVPFPGKPLVFKDSLQNEVLAVPVIFQQTVVDWGNLAVKIPGVFTTTDLKDLKNWKLSLIPLKNSDMDFLKNPRGDVGLISSWEPSLIQDDKGQFELQVRLNLPPVNRDGKPSSSDGNRAAVALGNYSPTAGFNWQTPQVVDYDVPVTRAATLGLPISKRWVMVQNHNIQGLSYSASGAPQFIDEKYKPYSRANMTVFFGTRGIGDYVAGLNLSSGIDEPNVEMVHYPDAVMVPTPPTVPPTEVHEQLFVVYSTHRRAGNCDWSAETPDLNACSDSIQFVRLNNLPSTTQPTIYPNHFAHYFDFGTSTPQNAVYSYTHNDKQNELTLFNRGSAGLEISGEQGVINLSFKMNSALLPGESRPVISFGRSATRTAINGLRLALNGRGTYDLLLGSTIVLTGLSLQTWIPISLQYDFTAKTLTVDGHPPYSVGSMSRRVYLGDPTLAKLARPLPDLVFDVGSMSLVGN